MKPGDYVLCEPRLSDDKGFRSVSAAVVQVIDEHPTDGHILVIVVPYATYAYHVSAPHLGRYVPPVKIDCFDIEELSPLGEQMLQDIVIARGPLPVSGR